MDPAVGREGTGAQQVDHAGKIVLVGAGGDEVDLAEEHVERPEGDRTGVDGDGHDPSTWADDAQPRLESRLHTGGVEDDLHPVALGQPSDDGRQILRRRIDHPQRRPRASTGPERSGGPRGGAGPRSGGGGEGCVWFVYADGGESGGQGGPADEGGFGDDDQGDAAGDEVEGHRDPDRTGAEHGRGPAGAEAAAADRVVGDGERLDQRAGQRIDAVRQRMGHVGADHGQFTEAAVVLREAVPDDGATQVVGAAPAGRALPAGPHRLDRDQGAGPQSVVGHLVADRHDLGGELVAEDHRAKVTERTGVPDMQVGAAQSGETRPQQQAVRQQGRLGHLLEPDVPSTVQTSGAHDSLLTTGPGGPAGRDAPRRRMTAAPSDRHPRRSAAYAATDAGAPEKAVRSDPVAGVRIDGRPRRRW